MSNSLSSYAGSHPVVGPALLARNCSGNEATASKKNEGTGLPIGGGFKVEETKNTSIKGFGVNARKAGKTYNSKPKTSPTSPKLRNTASMARPYCSLIMDNPRTVAAVRDVATRSPFAPPDREDGRILVCTCPTTHCANICPTKTAPCWGSSRILQLLRDPVKPTLIPSQVVWDFSRKEVRLNAKITALIAPPEPAPYEPRYKFAFIELTSKKPRVSREPPPFKVGKPSLPAVGFPYVDLKVVSIERRPRVITRKRKAVRVYQKTYKRPPIMTQRCVDEALSRYQCDAILSAADLTTLADWVNGAIVLPARKAVEAESLSHLNYVVNRHRHGTVIHFSHCDLLIRPRSRYDAHDFYESRSPLLSAGTFSWWRQVRDPRSTLLRLHQDDNVDEALDWLHAYQRNQEWWDVLFYANAVPREVLEDCDGWLEIHPTLDRSQFVYTIKDDPQRHGYASDMSPIGWQFLRTHAFSEWSVDFDPYPMWQSVHLQTLPTTFVSKDLSILAVEWLINYFQNRTYWDTTLAPVEAESVTLHKPLSSAHVLLQPTRSLPAPLAWFYTIMSMAWILIWGSKEHFTKNKRSFFAYIALAVLTALPFEFDIWNNTCPPEAHGCEALMRAWYAAGYCNPSILAMLYFFATVVLFIYDTLRGDTCTCNRCRMRNLPKDVHKALRILLLPDQKVCQSGAALNGLCQGVFTSVRIFTVVLAYNKMTNHLRTLAGAPSVTPQYNLTCAIALLLFVPLIFYFDPPTIGNFRVWCSRIKRKLTLLLTADDHCVELPGPRSTKLDEAIKFAEQEARKAAVAYATEVDCEAETETAMYAGAHAIIATMPDWVLADIGPQHVYGFQAIIDFCVTISCGPTLSSKPTYSELLRYYAHHYAALNLVVLAVTKHSMLRYVLTEFGGVSLTQADDGSWTLGDVPPVISVGTVSPPSFLGSSHRSVTSEDLKSQRDGDSFHSTHSSYSATERGPPTVEAENEKIQRLMGQYPPWLLDIEKLLGGTLELGKSKTMSHLEALLAALALAPWVSSMERTVDLTNLPEKETFVGVLRGGLSKIKDFSTFTRGVIDASVYFAKFSHNLYVTGGKLSEVYSYMESEGSSSIWLKAFDNHQLLMSGAYKQTKCTLPEIWDSFLVCESMLRNSLRSATGLAKMQLEKQAQMVLTFKQDWKAVANTFAVKAEPFTMTLYGSPGIGKTASVKYLLRFLHALIDEEHPKTSFVTESDAFDGGLDNATTAIVWDDIGNLNSDMREKTISERLIRYVNSYRTQFTGASLEEKNVKFNFAKICLFTTNSVTMGLKEECANPASAWRRLGMKIECIVRPEYSDGKGGFQREALSATSRPLDDYLPEQLEYQEYVIGDKGDKQYIGARMSDVELLQEVRDRCLKHVNFQKKSVESATDEPLVLCSHCMPKHVCRACHPLPQSSPEDSPTPPLTFWKSMTMRLLDKIYSHVMSALRVVDYDCFLEYRDKIYIWSILCPLVWLSLLMVLLKLYTDFNGSYLSVQAYNPMEECMSRSFWHRLLPHVHCKGVPTDIAYRIVSRQLSVKLSSYSCLLFPFACCLTMLMFYIWDCLLFPLRVLKNFSTTPVSSLMTGYTESQAVYSPSKKTRYTQWLLGSGALAAGLYALFIPRRLDVNVKHSGSLSTFQDIDVMFRTKELSSFERYKLSRELDAAVSKANSTLSDLLQNSLYVPAVETEGEEGDGTEVVIPAVLTLDKRKELVTESRQNWIQAIKMGSTGMVCGMTMSQAREKLRASCMSFTYLKEGSYSRSIVVALESRFLLLPDHAFKVEKGDEFAYVELLEGTLYRRYGENIIPLLCTLRLSASRKLEGSDLRLCVFNTADAFPNCVDLLPTKVAPPGAETICEFNVVDPDNLTLTSVKVEARRSISASRQAGSFESQVYSLPFDTYAGLCMSFLLRKTKTIVIEGFHVAGGKTDRIGRAALITRATYLDARDYLEQYRCEANRATGLSPVVRYNPVTQVDKVPHTELEKHSIGRFVPDELVIRYVEEFDKTSRRERHTFEPNAACQSAVAHFRFPITTHLPDINMRVLTRNTMILGCSLSFPQVDVDLLNEAFADFVTVVPLAVDRMLAKPWCRVRPLNYSEVLNGIPGHPYASTIKINTSAGWPFGVKKKQVLLKSANEEWYMPPAMLVDLMKTEIQVCVLGQHSGLPYTGTAKSEARDMSKHTARLFFGSPLFTYIMLHRFLVVPLSVINLSPELFETSLGRDRLSPNWHLHMLELLDGDPDRCNATDFSTYDQSQNPDVRIAATKVFIHICKCMGYSKSDLACVRMLVNEFLMPYLSLGGFVVLGTTIQPSGNNLTAHTNGIAASLLMRMSFFKHHPTMGRPFRDFVSMRTLGDDNIMSFSPLVDLNVWNGVVFADDCKAWGLLVTPSDKSQEIKPVSNFYTEAYLRSKPYYNLDLGRVVSVLDPHSIFKPLQYHERSTAVTPEEQLRDTLAAILNECFFYGEKCYTWAQRCALDVGKECGLPADCRILEKSYATVLQEKLQDDVSGYNKTQAWPVPKDCPTTPPYFAFWRGEWPDHVEAETEEGLVDFEMEQVTGGAVETKTMDLSPLSEAQAPFAAFFERSVAVASFSIPYDENFHHSFDPYTALFSEPEFAHKMNTWAVGRADVELTFIGSSTSAHSGLMQLSYVPIPKSNEVQDETLIENDLLVSMRSQRRCVYWDVATTGGAKIDVPFIWPYAALWLRKSSFSGLSKVYLNVVAPLLHVSNNTSPIQVTVYAKLKNFSFSGSTAVSVDAEVESFSTVVSALADAASLTSKYLAFAPQLAMVSDYASMTLNGIAGVARYFGHSRPIVTANFVSMYTSPPLATSNDNLNGRTLAMDRDQGVTMSSAATGILEKDPLVFESFYRPNILGVYQWSSNDEVGSKIFHLVNTCCQGLYSSVDNNVLPTTSALVTSNFATAHWVNKYRITIVTPTNNAGMLQLVSEPTGIPLGRSTVTNRSLIVDIQTSKVIDVTCEWQQPVTLRTTHNGGFLNPFGEYVPQCMNGALALYVETPLAAFSDTVQQAYIVIEGWIEKVRLGNYAPMDLTSYTLARGLRSITTARMLSEGPEYQNAVALTVGAHTIGSHGVNTAHKSYVPPVLTPTSKPIQLPTSSATPTVKPTNLPPTQTPLVPPTLHPSAPPTHNTDAPTTSEPSLAPVACEAVVSTVPLSLICGGTSGEPYPYLTADETSVVVPPGCTTLTIPVYSNGITTSQITMTVLDGAGCTLSISSGSHTFSSDSPSVQTFTSTFASIGMWTFEMSVTGNTSGFAITALQATVPSLYSWQRLNPSPLSFARTNGGGITLNTYKSDHANQWTLPIITAPYCGGPRGNVAYAVLYCEGIVWRHSSTAVNVATVPDVGLICIGYLRSYGLAVSSGYGTPVCYIRAAWYLGLSEGEVEFGSPYGGLEYIAPVHFGEQIFSFRTLWKVFKTTNLFYITGTSTGTTPSDLPFRSDGVVSLSAIARAYNVGEHHSGFQDLLTLDRLLFWCFGCVRGSMVGHYTIEQGDGLVKFRRGQDDTTTDSSARLRGFEQMHSSVQRSIVIHWPYYADERFLIPRDLSATEGTHARMTKQVELQCHKTASLTVREDSAIGEDFSVSYFLGSPVLRFDHSRGTSTNVFGNSSAPTPTTPAPTQRPTPKFTSAPTVKFKSQTHAPSTAEGQLDDDNLFDRRKLKERKSFFNFS